MIERQELLSMTKRASPAHQDICQRCDQIMAFLGPQSGANCIFLIKSAVCLGGDCLIIGDKSDKSLLK